MFFFRGTGLLMVVRKNQPLVPRSNFGGKACAGTTPWFSGRTLPVPGHGGGEYPQGCHPGQERIDPAGPCSCPSVV